MQFRWSGVLLMGCAARPEPNSITDSERCQHEQRDNQFAPKLFHAFTFTAPNGVNSFTNCLRFWPR